MSNLTLIVDEELTLRQFSVDDVDVIFNLINRNRDHLSQNGDTTSAKYETCDDVLQSILKPDNSLKLRCGIWAKEVYTGTVNLTPDEFNTAEVGYYLGQEFEGHGYARRSVERLIRYAFEETKLDSVFAKVHPANTSSIHVLERVGFVREDSKSTETDIFYFMYKNN